MLIKEEPSLLMNFTNPEIEVDEFVELISLTLNLELIDKILTGSSFDLSLKHLSALEADLFQSLPLATTNQPQNYV